MIVFIDDEKWIIEAYIDELDSKGIESKHFFYPKDALAYIENEHRKIDALVIDIGMAYDSFELMKAEQGGIQFFKELKSHKLLKYIPIIILTVYNKAQVEKELDDSFENSQNVIFINRNDQDRDQALLKGIKKFINPS